MIISCIKGFIWDNYFKLWIGRIRDILCEGFIYMLILVLDFKIINENFY